MDMTSWACNAKDVRHNAGYLGAEWRFRPTLMQDNEKPRLVDFPSKAVYYHDRLDRCYRLELSVQRCFLLTCQHSPP